MQRASRWIFNCYAIRGRDGQAVLVDPGLELTAAAALTRVRELGWGETSIVSVSSHGHSDHVGGMPLLRAQASCQTFLPVRCRDYLAGESPRILSKRAVLRIIPVLDQQPFCLESAKEVVRGQVGISTKAEFRFPYQPDGFLGDGAALPGAEDWEVIATPGHTDECISFYHSDSRTLISGDSVVTLDGRAWFNPERVDTKATRETEERLRALDVEHLLPGHGLPVSGDVWRRALSFRDRVPGRSVLARCSRVLSYFDRRRND